MDHGSGPFDDVQKEYLAGFFAGLASGEPMPHIAAPVDVAAAAETTVFGTPLEDLSKEERWKLEQNGLDVWEKIVACAESDTPPEGADIFRFKFHGLFYVAPAQDAFMVRVRAPANVLSSAQLAGLAEIAHDWGGGYGDITTRGNVQLRELRPKHIVRVLMKLHDLGLISRGAGADNVRNITATPTSGFDPLEVCDVRPLAKALQFYILNHRDLYGLPRKFNISFDSGGSVSVVADTNDIAFVARRVPADRAVPEGVYFRVLLAGVTGHGQFALDAGIIVAPHECVAVAAAMLRVFNENGDRTNRKKARLKYLIDRWGVDRFVAETEKKLAFPLRRFAEATCEPRAPVDQHGHLGVHPQRTAGRRYVGVAIPVGRLRSDGMRALASIAQTFGSGTLCPTVWQNVIIPDVRDEQLDDMLAALTRAGFSWQPSAVKAGLVACTGNTGCKFSATNTKGQAIELGDYLESRVTLDRPINIHLTGCPNSCAQHYVGDIGLLGVNVTVGDRTVEAYNVVVGGGTDERQAIARELVSGVPFERLPTFIAEVIRRYQAGRVNGESFSEFVRRHEPAALRSLLVPTP